MKHFAYTRPLIALLLVVAVGLTGCTDAVMDAGTSETEEATANPKFRNAHLFGEQRAGKLLTRYEDATTETDFVLRAYDTTLEMNKLLTRYEDLDGVTVERSYQRVFKGFAINVVPERVPAVLDYILADGQIEWVEPDARLKHNKPSSTNINGKKSQYLDWGVDQTDADQVSGLLAKGLSNVDVFILDTGISATMDVAPVSEKNFTGSANTSDYVGHGTHIAGTALAPNNREGVLGVGAGARLHNYKVLDDNGQTESSVVIEAVDQITAMKLANPLRPMVVNISFGADIGTTAYTALDDAIAASIDAGVIYVIAAGNEGIDASTVTPAHVTGAITVGAHDASNRFASFSNYGPVVDILAPGVDIVSLPSKQVSNNDLVRMSGTSMAAPHVTGAVALYLAVNPAGTPAEVEQALVGLATSSIGGTPKSTTNRSVFVGSLLK